MVASVATSTPTADNVWPTSCPIWCDRAHHPEWRVHSVEVSTIMKDATTGCEIAVKQYGTKDPVVEIVLLSGSDETVMQFAPGTVENLVVCLAAFGQDGSIAHAISKAVNILDCGDA
ncbi:hypothetical protein [Phytoactinopolyspora endophytica]|uniref:hypothetical protein n=1 Tax=Phytoactinopolyspora endophytica TaxID=1642495 RepID=UPI00101D4B82|nr:hypothetical protein [Phytoactinopolyspora endophytica]